MDEQRAVAVGLAGVLPVQVDGVRVIRQCGEVEEVDGGGGEGDAEVWSVGGWKGVSVLA